MPYDGFISYCSDDKNLRFPESSRSKKFDAGLRRLTSPNDI